MKNLNEIVELCDKALLVVDAKVISTEVEALNKTAFISMGGVLDSIKLLAKDMLGEHDPLKDNVDRPSRHSIAGHMNDSTLGAKITYEKEHEEKAKA